ncbi:hypothetical protein [Tindallia californiensis]|uniref:Uncharacterized protein n=1 Tax=Tindallia californiensis TaxID=159292 RepID=A0A1H3QT88_9FIRM|nr:hypothetical protein [Tindallia californiensis]SDZ16271.1 hypothetical protein SAMN05192546_11089 [Tindallia californiensis]
MKAIVWENERTTYEVEVLGWTPPQRQRISVDQIGGPSSYVSGKVIPGSIRIIVPINFNIDNNYSIEIYGKKMRLEIMKIDNSEGISIAEGVVY